MAINETRVLEGHVRVEIPHKISITSGRTRGEGEKRRTSFVGEVDDRFSFERKKRKDRFSSREEENRGMLELLTGLIHRVSDS